MIRIPIKYLYVGLFTMFLSSCMAYTPEEISTRYPIIPQPVKLHYMTDSFVLDANTTVVMQTQNEELHRAADFLIDYVAKIGLFQLNYSEANVKGKKIVFALCDTMKSKESYRLEITKNDILISAGGGEGAFYAVQTVRQLLPCETEKKLFDKNIILQVPAVSIYDTPRFAYRGLMLDVARYYFPISHIKKQIDLMALYKFNVLHLHLTEDQGWRIEIKSHPELTEVGAWRKQSIVGHKKDVPRRYDGKPHGGYYTQAELKELVAYAKNKCIEIIPEIEMPGHTQAVLAAYPQLACVPGKYEVSCDWGVHKNVLCTKEESFKLLEDVLAEVCDIFPSKYIHIGGDECPKDRWKGCETCQNNIKRLGLKDENELQSYFIGRIEKFVNSHGKNIIGWDEILEGGLAPNATVMSWRGEEGGLKAARMAHPVIMTPRNYCYLDYYQADKKNEPIAISGFVPLDSVYSYNPTAKLTPEYQKWIWGVQGNVWAEYISTPQHAEYMSFPRAIAIAEIGWSSQEKREYANFILRLTTHAKRLDVLNVNYAKHFLFQNNNQ